MSTTAIDETDPHRSRAIGLFTFLREVASLRSKTVRSVDEYEREGGSVLWLADFPDHKDCRCTTWADGAADDDAWIEVSKQTLVAAPEPSASLAPWLEGSKTNDSSVEQPMLNDSIALPPAEEGGEARTERLDDHPEVIPAFERYLQSWKPWAVNDRVLRAVNAVYQELFSAHQLLTQVGESYEIVLGFGLLKRRNANGREIKRHLLTCPVSLEFESEHGVITVGPTAGGSRLSLEQDMVDEADRPGHDVSVSIDALLTESWHEGVLETILRNWVNGASASGLFEEGHWDYNQAATADPVVRMAPALMVRRRTSKGLLKTLDEIIRQLNENESIPLGVQRLVDVIDDREHGDGNEGRASTSPRIYFPLLANEEQVRIAQKLEARQGVLVQGPPGTGKSHTIANLICHLLASGKRVLVTSHTNRALKVLKSKIPPEVSALCVTLLGDDPDSLQALENSVQSITDRHHAWTREDSEKQIAALERTLDELNQGRALQEHQLREIREQETREYRLDYGGYVGTLQRVALRLQQEREEFSWMLAFGIEECDVPPLDNGEIATFVRFVAKRDEALEQELERSFPSSGSLMPPAELQRAVTAESEFERSYAAVSELRGQPLYSVVASATREQRQTLRAGLLAALTRLEPWFTHGDAWVPRATREILNGDVASWARRANKSEELVRQLMPHVENANLRKISGADGKEPEELRTDAEFLLAELSANRGLSGLGYTARRLVNKHLKSTAYLVDAVKVDGRQCHSQQPLSELRDWATCHILLSQLDILWTSDAPPAKGLLDRASAYQRRVELLQRLLELKTLPGALRQSFLAIPGMSVPTLTGTDVLHPIKALLDAADCQADFDDSRLRIDALARDLREQVVAGGHPVLGDMSAAVNVRNVSDYKRHYERLGILCAAREESLARRALSARLTSHSEQLALRVWEMAASEKGRGLLERFEQAWSWRRAWAWLQPFTDPQAVVKLSAGIEQITEQINATMAALAAELAWVNCFSRMNEKERASLVAWSKAVKRIGKGTGKHVRVEQHRRAAAEHMNNCRDAIPAWIMPIHRVAESVGGKKDAFDVVIVDEASQSGLEALFLFWVGAKLVVVGDDKQISPEVVGLDQGVVDGLRNRYLRDVPYNDAMQVGQSLFDQADIRYSGRIRLREHFRCMPEIIQFCNNLSYQAEPLEPLRQYGMDRLEPVIHTRHVPNGYMQGGTDKVNPPEAQAVVEHIVACLKHEQYAGKTFGVISLVGNHQAKAIYQLLVQVVPPEVMAARQLICGDAYTFQGDERDVMFLSMVTAPSNGRAIGAFTSQSFEKRFNVAVSRARDQLWLFHSVTSSDLSPQCLRRKLLEYCFQPSVQALSGVLPEWQAISERATRDRKLGLNPPAPLESWFEVDVYLSIAARGFRVRPQVEVAGHRIDLVVEGMRGRLAVECDGDAWHGPDRYEHDSARQRKLERCGWTFWRVRGGSYYRDPEAALEDLWTTLAQLKIHPSANGDTTEAEVTAIEITPVSLEGLVTLKSASPRVTSGHPEDPVGCEDPEARVSEAPRASEELPVESLPAVVSAGLPDPRSARRKDVVDALVQLTLEIGPVVCSLLFSSYVKRADLQRLGDRIENGLQAALEAALRERRLASADEFQSTDRSKLVIRCHGADEVRIRKNNERDLFDIPPLELAAVMEEYRFRGYSGKELFRAVIKDFGYVSLSAPAEQHLQWIYQTYVSASEGQGDDWDEGTRVDES